MAGVPGTASKIFEAVKDTGANVVMISQVRKFLYLFVWNVFRKVLIGIVAFVYVGKQ